MFKVGGRKVLGRHRLQRSSVRFASSEASNRVAGGAVGRNLLLSAAIGATAYAGGALYALDDADFRKTMEWVPGGIESIELAQQTKEVYGTSMKTVSDAFTDLKKSTEDTIESAQKAIGGYAESARKTVDGVSSTVSKTLEPVLGKKADTPSESVKTDAGGSHPVLDKKPEAQKPVTASAWKKPESKAPAPEVPVAKVERPGKPVVKPKAGEKKPAAVPPPAPANAEIPEESIPVSIRLAAAVSALNKELESSKLPAESKAGVREQLDKVTKQLSALEKEQAILVGAAVTDTISHFDQEITTLVESYQKTLAIAQSSVEYAVDSHVAEVRQQVSAAKDAEAKELLSAQAAEFERTLRDALSAQSEAIQLDWRREVKERVDKERGGRLARLDGLELKLKVLEVVAKENGESAARMDTLRQLRNAVARLKLAVEDGGK
ncbi:hypothetical protein HDU93_000517, partial [Gonapodya sp. JEL0774]